MNTTAKAAAEALKACTGATSVTYTEEVRKADGTLEVVASHTTAAPTDLLAVGTPVTISQTGVWMEGTKGTIERAYRIRHGHPMYDIRTSWGNVLTYYAGSQLTVDAPAAPAHLQPQACYVCGATEENHTGTGHGFWTNAKAAEDFAKEPQGSSDAEARYVQQHRPE